MKRTTTPCFTKFDQATRTWGLDLEKAYLGFKEAYVVAGVLRWKSNDHVPPQDCLEDFRAIGCGGFDMEACRSAREAEQTAFLADYAAKERNRKPSAEERYEMEAAFGKGTTVVNVITGRRTRV